MALKVWLPLNKDTRNVGLNNVKATNNGATLTNGGVYNNCYHFGTASSYMTLPPSCMTGFTTACTVSFWLRIKTWNTSYATFFQAGKGSSPWAHYVFGFLRNASNSTVCFTISNSSSSSQNNYLTSALNLNTWYHVVLIYETGKCKIYLNGTLDHQYTTTFVPYFAGITKITLGACNATSSYQTNCDMNDLRIYDQALTEEDVLRIYNNRSIFEIPYSQEAEKPEYPLWLKLLHHNAPANNLFTAANCKKNSDNDLYSRCGWLFGNTIFKLDNGKYEMLAKEKTESGSTENIFRWTQTSSPTASTITGFSAITNVSGSHLLGLKHNGNYAALHNGSTYWCACGSYTKYNGGNPGFKDVIKSGYLDLFVRAEIKHLPSKYEELEYIQSTGTQYIDTGINPKIKPRAVVKMAIINATDCDYWGNNAVNGSCYYADFKSYKLQYYRYGTTTSQNVNFTVGQNEIHVWDVSDKVYVDGSLKFTSTNTYTYNSSQKTIQIFKAARASYYSSYKLYNFKLYDGDELCRNFVPAKRKSDNVIGLYDLVSHKFFTNSGSGSFTGA